LEGQVSVERLPFNFRGRPRALVFKKPPSVEMPRGGPLEAQPHLAVIDDVNDREPEDRPREGFNFFYWDGPPGTLPGYNPAKPEKPCLVDVRLVPDPSNPLPSPCSPAQEQLAEANQAWAEVGCYPNDNPLPRLFKRGNGLDNKVVFAQREHGYAIFTDLEFVGHPGTAPS